MNWLWSTTRRLCGVDALNLRLSRRRARQMGEIAGLLDAVGMHGQARDLRAVTP